MKLFVLVMIIVMLIRAVKKFIQFGDEGVMFHFYVGIICLGYSIWGIIVLCLNKG